MVAGFCDRILVMYAGQIVEEIAASRLHEAHHPYTRALLSSRPRLDDPQEELTVPQRSEHWSNPLEAQP